MKPLLHHKIPLAPNLTASQAAKYIEFYHYLEHYNFGPYYIDDIVLPNIKVLYFEQFDAAFKIKSRPALTEYLDRWYPDRNFHPANATNIVWVTFELFTKGVDGEIICTVLGASLDQLLNKNGKLLDLKYFMRIDHAEQLRAHFLYLVKKCILLPGYYLIKSIDVVDIKNMPPDSPLSEFVKSRKNKELLAQGDYSVIATICKDANINGCYSDVKYYFLCDLLNKYQVKLISKQE